MTQLTIELFDKFGRFQMPSDDVLVSLSDAERSRFEAVQSASSELETATANRIAAEQAVTDAIKERDDAQAELMRVRPKISQTQLAKEFIASARAE